MNEYALPDLETIAGTVQIKLYSSIAGLTAPTVQTIVELGDLEETADVDIGVTQLSTLSLSLREDYTTYAEGFWYKVLAAECWLRFYLVENGTTTFYFFGIPQEETIEWTEHFLDSTYLRTAKLELTSMAFKMLDTATTDWETEVVNNSVNTGAELDNGPSYKISVKGLFSAMLKASGLNSSYNESDTAFVRNTADFVYNPGAGDRTLDDLSIAVKMFVAPGSQATTEYFSGSNKLSIKFAKLRDLLPNLLANFGVLLKMDYDPVNERHLIKLVQRGRAYSVTNTFSGREKESRISKSFDLLGDAVRSTLLLDTNAFVWFSKKYLNGKSTASVPNYVEFDADPQCIFICNGPITGLTISRSLWYVFGTTWTLMTSVKYWDPAGQAYITAGTNPMQEAIAGYLYYRFTNKFSRITRKYGKLNANNGTTDSHVNAAILQRTSINDGTGAKNYYANKVKKSLVKNELEIEWIQE